jgi:phosphate starvation-inducible PhoH-like protein
MKLSKHNRERRFHQRYEQPQQKTITIKVKGISQNQINYLQSIRENDFTLALGHAGSGKTYCAVGMALKYLFMQDSGINKIVIIRRAIPACEDGIGHLPGDAFDKMYPYFGSVLDNIEEFVTRHVVRSLIKEEKLEIIPLAFLRGRTLKNCFIIVEEAQNVTIEGMKMILTRVGASSKIVVTGDVNQRDQREVECGLLDASIRFKDVSGFGIIHLYAEEDIVRNQQTSRIIELYAYNDETT